MNKKLFNYIIVICLCVILAFSLLFVQPTKPTQATNSRTKIKMKTFKSDTDNCVYNSSGDSIEELNSKADACITGTVTNEYDLSDFSVIQIINVDQTIKGNNIDSQINLLRMKRDQLEEDITYTLLIAKRESSETDDIYYVLGGYEGVIFKEENGTLTAMNNRIE